MARSIPVKKFWTVTLTKKSKPKSPKTPTTAKEQLDVKIKTVSTQLSANFNNCAHLLRHELSKSTWAENQNDPEYLSRIFHNRIDSLWWENLQDFVCYITLSTLRSLTNSSNTESFQRPDTITKLRDSILPIITEEMIGLHSLMIPGIHTEHFRELIFIMNGTNHHETHSRTNSRKCVLHSTSQRIHEHFHQSDNRSCIHIPQTNRYRPASNNIRTPHKLSAILH